MGSMVDVVSISQVDRSYERHTHSGGRETCGSDLSQHSPPSKFITGNMIGLHSVAS